MLLDYIQIGQTISVSYYGKDGKTHIKDIQIPDDQFFNWKYCSSPNSKERDPNRVSWDDKAVKKAFIPYQETYTDKTSGKKRSRTVNSLSIFRIAEIIDDLPKEEYDEIFEYNLPRTFFVDIETGIDNELTVKESAVQTRKPITVIGIATPEKDVIVLSSEKDLTAREKSEIQFDMDNHTKHYGAKFNFRFKCFGSEVAMLKYFLGSMVSKFPMMTGWNFIDFDWKYIINRSTKLGIKDPVKLASPIGKAVGKDPMFPAHVGVIDYMQAYAKWDTSVQQKENLKLDQAGSDVLGVKKVSYDGTLDDLYEKDFKKYVYYNAIDCALVAMLHDKLGVSAIGNTLTYIAKCPTMRMFSPVSLTESIMARDYYAQGKVLPAVEMNSVQQPYDGAYVKKPEVGFHINCICNDFASLYPNIIRELNLSPETLVEKLEESDTARKNRRLSEGYIVSESGCVFKQDPGVFSTLVGRVYNQRKSYKKTAVAASIAARLLEDLLKRTDLSDEEIEREYEKITG